MRSKKGKTEENENIAYDNEIDDKKINYTDFLKDTEEIEAQIMQEEEERLKRRKEKMKKLASITPKALKELEEKETPLFHMEVLFSRAENVISASVLNAKAKTGEPALASMQIQVDFSDRKETKNRL